MAAPRPLHRVADACGRGWCPLWQLTLRIGISSLVIPLIVLQHSLPRVDWKAQFVDRKIKGVVEDLFKTEDRGLVRLIRKNADSLSPSEIRSSLKRARLRVDFPLVFMDSEPSELPRGRPNTTGVADRKVRRSRQSIGYGGGARKALGEHPEHKGVHVRDLIRADLLKPPLELETLYKGVVLKATVQADGNIVFDGETYPSLSTAAGMARATVVGAPPGRRYPPTNGWLFWRYRDLENGKLEKIDVLRQAVKPRFSV